MRQPGNPQGSSNAAGKFGRRDMITGSNFYPDGTQNDNYLLKPIAYFGGQSGSSQRHKFSSVPDLWAVRGSPDFDVNHKKYSVNSDTAGIGYSSAAANPSCSYELVPNNPDPVLKLIVTSHESVYLSFRF